MSLHGRKTVHFDRRAVGKEVLRRDAGQVEGFRSNEDRSARAHVLTAHEDDMVLHDDDDVVSLATRTNTRQEKMSRVC